MKIIVIICFLLNLSIYSAQPGGNLPNQGVMGKVGGEIFDPSIDFAHQTARVSDIDDGRTIFKLNFLFETVWASNHKLSIKKEYAIEQELW